PPTALVHHAQLRQRQPMALVGRLLIPAHGLGRVPCHPPPGRRRTSRPGGSGPWGPGRSPSGACGKDTPFGEGCFRSEGLPSSLLSLAEFAGIIMYWRLQSFGLHTECLLGLEGTIREATFCQTGRSPGRSAPTLIRSTDGGRREHLPQEQ